jgi:hypothetical protein
MKIRSFEPDVLFHGTYDIEPRGPKESITDTFTVLDVDGVYLVISHKVTQPGAFKREYKAFLEEKHAFAYLRGLGVVREEDEAEVLEERIRDQAQEDYIFQEYARECGLYRE